MANMILKIAFLPMYFSAFDSGLNAVLLGRPDVSRPGSNTLSSDYHLLRKLGSQNLMLLNGRRRAQEIRGIGKERLGDGPIKVGLSPGLIGKRIEYSERGWAQTQREPQRRGGFLLRHLKALFQEGGYVFLLPGFRFQSYKQSKFKHFQFSLRPKLSAY